MFLLVKTIITMIGKQIAKAKPRNNKQKTKTKTTLFMGAFLISPCSYFQYFIISYKQLRKVKLGVLEIFSSLFIIKTQKTIASIVMVMIGRLRLG